MSGVLYVSEFTRRRNAGAPLQEAVIEGATAQFRAPLMLIVVAMLGRISAALAHGIGCDIQRPLAAHEMST